MVALPVNIDERENHYNEAIATKSFQQSHCKVAISYLQVFLICILLECKQFPSSLLRPFPVQIEKTPIIELILPEF